MTPVISIICTAKNASTTIDETILSVRCQTLQELQMVIVDDGSKDGTIECVGRHCREDPRIHLVRTVGVGRAPALNLALKETSCDLVANIDADDLMHPELLQTLLNALEKHAGFSIICAGYKTIGATEAAHWRPSRQMRQSETPVDITRMLMLRNPICHSAVIMQKEAVLSVGGYDESLARQIDYDLWIRLAAANHKIGQISSVLAAKRIHHGQSFEARNRLSYLINSARTQARAISQLRGGWHHWFFLILRIIWAARPRRFGRRYSGGSRNQL